MPKILTPEQEFCLQGCRSYAQYFKMRQDFESGDCTFCHLDRTLNSVIYEDDYVFAWHAPEEYMRKELARHWLVVPKRHVRFEAELTNREVVSIQFAKRFMHKHFGYMGGLTHVREGDMRLNAGTVPHLHYNTFVPNQTAESRIPVFKYPEDREKNEERSIAFSKDYEAGTVPT